MVFNFDKIIVSGHVGHTVYMYMKLTMYHWTVWTVAERRTVKVQQNIWVSIQAI